MRVCFFDIDDLGLTMLIKYVTVLRLLRKKAVVPDHVENVGGDVGIVDSLIVMIDGRAIAGVGLRNSRTAPPVNARVIPVLTNAVFAVPAVQTGHLEVDTVGGDRFACR